MCAEVDHWNETKPAHFAQLWPPDLSTTGPEGSIMTSDGSFKSFAEIIMMNDVHVVAMQYYDLAKLLLTSHNPRMPRFGIEAVRMHREADRQAVILLRTIVGLALSNPKCTNARHTACHVLHACGIWLSEDRHRREAIDFLTMMEHHVGWRKGNIIEMLKQQWGL